MAFYKQACIHCGTLVDRDAAFCPACGSDTPFQYRCVACLRQISYGDAVCGGCGRPLYTECPKCGAKTFVLSRCEKCGGDLTIVCPNKHCGRRQFFENKTCTACGKTIKKGR